MGCPLFRSMFFGRLCLQGNAVLPDGQFPVAQIFGAGGQTGGCGHHPVQQSLCGIIPRVPLHQRTGVEVDPSGLALGQGGVGGDLQRGDRPGKGRSPSSGEEHHVRSRRRQSGGGYQIVAGGLEHGQTPVLHPLTIGQHPANGGAAALLDTAQRLLLQCGDAAGLVAGGGIFIHHLPVADE